VLKCHDEQSCTDFQSAVPADQGLDHAIRAEEKIRAVAADATAAELLRVPRDTPLLCVERVAFSYGEKPVEFRRGYYRTDKHYYRNELG